MPSHTDPVDNQGPHTPLPELDTWGEPRMSMEQAGIAVAGAALLLYIATNEMRAAIAAAPNAERYDLIRLAMEQTSVAAWDAYHSAEGPFNHEVANHCLWHPKFEMDFGAKNISISIKKAPTPEATMADFIRSLLSDAFPGMGVEIIPGEMIRALAELASESDETDADMGANPDSLPLPFRLPGRVVND